MRDAAARALAAGIAALAILAFGYITLAAPGARGQQRECAPLPALEARLAAEYGEAVRWAGLLARAPLVIRLYTNPTARTWTILVVAPDGCAGVLDAGTMSGFAPPTGPAGERGKPKQERF